ncbi:SPOR domain-containing protein [Marinicella sediminis]|uniref:SPOR domain-containing protein n=1 Tax=Marinicella sediminis TaxID=1792834 RepID=A0ABV7J6W0_9GAMM|nr:SPOR domain-containing protein [Marinicella sediminis]
MRYLFIVLLMANIAFFVWTQRIAPPEKKSFQVVDPGVKALQLVAEAEPDKPTESINNQSSVNDDVKQMCFSAGPFDIEANVHAAAEIVNPVVLKSNIRKITTTQEAGYWVYLPALSSRAEALKKGRELAAAFVKDYYVVTSGDNENSISLGLYREPYNADSRIAELQKKGFQVNKEIRIEQWPEFWLDFSVTETQLPGLPDLKASYPDVSQNEVICKNN